MSFPAFYPILDTALLAPRGLSITDAARAMCESGVRIIQLRHKGPYTRELFDTAEAIAHLCRKCGASFIVNDRADIARMLDAGLHVGQDDLTPADARHVLGSSRTLGLSTHNRDQFQAALVQPVDYIAFGPIFPTASKKNPDPVAGLAHLSAARTLTTRPLIAIGGITRALAGDVLAQGADSVAVIADLYPDPLDASSLANRVREWLAITG